MTRLDRHVATVQTKIILRRFFESLAWCAVALGAVMLLAVAIEKFFQIFSAYLPWAHQRWGMLLLIGGGVCLAVAGVWAFTHRPTREEAAAAIDDRLRLKEKFSTAIFVRPSTDPFAVAAVRDAESTADRVQLGKHFPIPYPRAALVAKLLIVAAFLSAKFVPTMNVFGAKQQVVKKQEQLAEQLQAKQNIDRALAQVQSMPKQSQDNAEFRKLVAELKEFQASPKIADPARANRRALQALQEVNNEVAKDWDKAKKYAEAQNSLLQSLKPEDDAQGPVGEARKEISKGNFDNAAKQLEEAVKNFDKMDEGQKKDQAAQMAKAAQQLQQMAQNPQMQQQIQQQLQQMGANQQQAQQMQQLMQQAAQGGAQGQQAQQQLQQMAQQMAQQMNNGQGANQQQQQQMQQAMQQMQAQANAQNQANGLAQAAQQMAQAMQNAANQQQQGANGQQNPQQGQQMANAQQQMQQALNNMQGVKQDLQQMAQQMQQAQQAMQQGQQAANGQQQGGAQGQQGQPGQGQQGQGQNGQFQQGQVQNGQQGNGRGGPGIAAGGNSSKDVTPFGIKTEQSSSADDEKGKILASYLVKDSAPKGDMKAAIAEIAEKAEKESADEVDSEHASRAAQKAAQEYFRTMAKENKGGSRPSPRAQVSAALL